MPQLCRLFLPILLVASALASSFPASVHAEVQAPSAVQPSAGAQDSTFCQAIWETVKRLPDGKEAFASSSDFHPGFSNHSPEIRKSLIAGFTTMSIGGIFQYQSVARNYSPLGRNHIEKRPVLAELVAGLAVCFPSHTVTTDASMLASGTEWETMTTTFTPGDELQLSVGQQPAIVVSPADGPGVFLDIVWAAPERWNTYLKGLQRYLENGCSLRDDACLMRKFINGR